MLPSFIADENIDVRLINRLREAGISIISIYDDYRGISDFEIVKLVKRHHAILITEDKDFGEWVFSHKKDDISVILLRYKHEEEENIREALLKLIFDHKMNLHGKFVVVAPNRIRVRDMS